MDGYVRFDEFEDVVVSVELIALLARLLDEHPSYWKWVIIAAQGALQGAMVCALANPASNSSPTRGKFPNERLEKFNVLLCRCTSGPEPLLKLTSEQKRDIKQLHDHFRNNFAHFVPQGWAIPKLELPSIISAALYAVERLMTKWPVSSHVSELQQDRFSKALQEWKKAPLPSV